MEKNYHKDLLAAKSIESSKKKELPTDLAIATLVILNLSLILLDFYSHPHQGIADLERRRMLEMVLGKLAKYIGNYGFSSCMASAAVFLKHGFESIAQIKKQANRINYKFLLRTIAFISVLNLTIESFTPNNQFAGDVSLGITGAFGGTLSAALLINRVMEKYKTRQLAEKTG